MPPRTREGARVLHQRAGLVAHRGELARQRVAVEVLAHADQRRDSRASPAAAAPCAAARAARAPAPGTRVPWLQVEERAQPLAAPWSGSGRELVVGEHLVRGQAQHRGAPAACRCPPGRRPGRAASASAASSSAATQTSGACRLRDRRASTWPRAAPCRPWVRTRCPGWSRSSSRAKGSPSGGRRAAERLCAESLAEGSIHPSSLRSLAS